VLHPILALCGEWRVAQQHTASGDAHPLQQVETKASVTLPARCLSCSHSNGYVVSLKFVIFVSHCRREQMEHDIHLSRTDAVHTEHVTG
jgi:hypothetical protein